MDTFNQHQACEDDCPIKKFAQIIEGKWTTLVIRELLADKKRYSELQKALTGISPKILSARLRLLEDMQLLTRTVYPTIPPSTEYELTELGRKLQPVLMAMAEFGSLLQQQTDKPAAMNINSAPA